MSEQLQQYIEKIEALEVQASNIRADIRGVYAEARSNGFDAKAIREVIKLRKMNKPDREEFDFLREKYKKQLGL